VNYDAPKLRPKHTRGLQTSVLGSLPRKKSNLPISESYHVRLCTDESSAVFHVIAVQPSLRSKLLSIRPPYVWVDVHAFAYRDGDILPCTNLHTPSSIRQRELEWYLIIR
jgi:hypothetical protein